jgi:tetratricopeptide (TPR) repeat protein
MEVRRAPVEVQLNKEFWRYCRRQFTLWGGDDWPQVEAYGAQHADQGGVAGLGARMAYLWRLLLPANAALPLLLGFVGGFYAFFRDKKGFAYNFVFLGLNTAGLIVFLNFSPHEVRDRDYFYQSGYHAFAIWIGFGVTWLIGWVRESFGEGKERAWGTIAITALLVLMPAFLLKDGWFHHDRSHNYVARDYAYDMLAPLKPNSFIFTNGDNDTFPLWYIQQVEGFRKDVRIVNLSLLNTDWYIKQLKDEVPKVPIDLPDAFIESRLGQGVFTDENGNPHYGPDGRPVFTNEYMVHHIMEKSKNADGSWKMQPYFAVTVPEHYGYERNFALQGLVYEVRNDTTQAGLDVEATKKALYQTFMYRGLFTADGSWDTKVFKDDNAETLSRNYAAAHLQLANYYHRAGDLKGAISEMERICRMFPNFVDAQLPLGTYYLENRDTAKAMAFFRDRSQRDPANPEARYLYGASLALQGDIERAVHEFDAAILLEPDYGQPYIGAYYLLRQAGQKERALVYLARWVESHPQDTQAEALLQAERGTSSSGGAPPRPPGGLIP